MRVVVAMRRAAERAQARRSRREGAAQEGPSLEDLTAGHARQLAFCEDKSRWIIALCSRRAGKTTGIAYRMLMRALRGPSRQVYIALTKGQARHVTMWEPIWLPLLRRLGIEAKHDQTEMITTFANGSVCRFTGSDDVRHIETELGSALDEAILDECQSASDAVLKPLITRILPPSLADRRGTLLMAGTVPEVEAGMFWDVWSTSDWSKHNWSMFDNPFMPYAREDLEEYLSKNPGITIDDPEIQRERFGNFVFDKNATAYGYIPALNAYTPTMADWLEEFRASLPEPLRKMTACLMAAVPMPGIEYISIAIDPGGGDRASIEGNGWGTETNVVQHLFDWATVRNANATWDQMGSIYVKAATMYKSQWGWYDTTSQNELDTFSRLYQVPVLKPAVKSDMPGQIRLVRNLCASGRYKVMAGSAMEEDLKKARLDPAARAKGQWKWTAAWHPDPSEANRYSLRPYFDLYQPAAPPPKDDLEAHRAEVRAMLEEARQQADAEQDRESGMGWG